PDTVRDGAEPRKLAIIQSRSVMDQSCPDQRYSGESGDFFTLQDTNDLCRKPVLEQYDRGGILDCGQKLVQSIIEAERKDRQNAFRWAKLQVGRDNARASQQIAMRQHDSARLARGSRGVKNSRTI